MSSPVLSSLTSPATLISPIDRQQPSLDDDYRHDHHHPVTHPQTRSLDSITHPGTPDDHLQSDFSQTNSTITLLPHRRQSGLGALVESSNGSACTDFLCRRLIDLEDLGLKSQGLPIRYRDLSVLSNQIDHEIIQSLPWAVLASLVRPFGLVSNLIGSLNPLRLSKSYKPNLISRTQLPILSQIDGLINQSEMLLVLGRPRSGMTTLLRALSLNHQSFSALEGHLDFGSLSPELIQRHGLKPLIGMIEENDAHLASLKAIETLLFAANCRTPRSKIRPIDRSPWAHSEVANWAKVFGLSSPTLETLVGSELVRGLSGGERKRVSIIEGLLTRSAALCLDNVTAGLDSVNSYHLIKSLKQWSKIDQTSTVIGLRQAGDGLYHLFDKVSVLYEGHQIYFGPTSEAVEYFVRLGFLQTKNQPITDFLCSVTDPLTRKISPNPPHPVPLTPSEFVAAFRRSDLFDSLKGEMLEYDSRYPSSGPAHHILATVPTEKDWFLFANSRWTINYLRQLIYLTRRQYALIRADLRPYLTKTLINMSLSLIIGTLFYQLPKTTEAAFSRGSVLFLSVLFNGYLQLSELGNTLMGRQIVQRHGRFGFYSRSTLALARTLGDIPLIAAQVLLFASMTYGLAGLQKDIVRFGIYILLVNATAINLTAVFRMFAEISASFDEAMRYCGLTLNIFVIYGGYFIPTPSMRAWFKWIRNYLDPVSRAFEAVLSNELHGLKLECSPQHIVPRGPSYTDPTYQTCAMAGSRPGSLVVLGDDYLLQSYGFEYHHLWLNLVMILGSTVVVLVLSVLFSNYLSFDKSGSIRLFKNSSNARKKLRLMQKMLDLDEAFEEEGILGGRETLGERVRRTSQLWASDNPAGSAHFDSAVLTFTDLKLCIKDHLHPRVLLNGVTGYFEPGELTALMGESGSGKTTLLNALAGRANYAYVSGEILIDGRLPTADSYRAIGYVQQTDRHDEYSTVKEALVFSALLRQPKSIPRWAKLADVDRVIAWLDLKHLEDAIVGTPEAGLGLEDRKKLSIAVELVSRPRILCLDEPVSGMDSQSATHIIQLLRRLVLESNLTVILTVHQPSVEIFESFDRLMLLEKGGNMVYFGPRDRAVAYFEAKSSITCGPAEHPAEYLIDSIVTLDEARNRTLSRQVIGHPSDQAVPVNSRRVPRSLVDGVMHSHWRLSPERIAVLDKIAQLNSEAFSLDQSLFNNQRGGVIHTEIIQLTKRFSRNFWRDSSFSFTQLFTATAVSEVIGLSFFAQASLPSRSFSLMNIRTTSLVGLQNQVFSTFLILFIPPVFMNQFIGKWFQSKSIYETREKLAGSYRELSLAIGFLLAELPYCLLSGLIFWAIWFFSVGFRIEPEVMGFTLAAVQMFFFFQLTWAVWIAALAPTIGIVGNLLPFFLVSMEAFNGSLLPYDQMPNYWRWMYWVSPFQWYIKSVLSMVLPGQKVTCLAGESVQFFAPKPMSCERYSREFLENHTGYLMKTAWKHELESKGSELRCEYCEYSSGDEFLTERFKTTALDRYRSIETFGVYCLLNLLLIFLIISFKSGGFKRFNLVKNQNYLRS